MLNPEIILENYKNYLLTDKTCSFVIKHLCSLFNIKFRTSKVFIEDMITFIHRDNDMWSSDSGVILWAYAIDKYKLTLHTKDTYSNNVYSKISDNAIILLNINGINPQKSVDDDYLIRYLTACFYFIAKHHMLDSKNSWTTRIRVIDFAQRCLDNLSWRYQNKPDLNKSLLATNSSNVNTVYNAKHAVTLGTAPVNERMKETKKITKMISNMRNSKFTQEEKDFVIEQRKSGLTIENTIISFKDKFGKSISLGTVRKITSGVILPKNDKKYVKRLPLTKEEKKFIIDGLLASKSVSDITCMFCNKFSRTIPEQTVYTIRRNHLSNEEKSKSDRRMRKNDIKPGIGISGFILNTQGKIKACPYNYMLFMKAFNISVQKSGSNFIVNGEKVPNIHPNDLRKRIERGMLKEDPITPLMAMIKENLSLNKNPKIEDIYAALVMCMKR